MVSTWKCFLKIYLIKSKKKYYRASLNYLIFFFFFSLGQFIKLKKNNIRFPPSSNWAFHTSTHPWPPAKTPPLSPINPESHPWEIWAMASELNSELIGRRPASLSLSRSPEEYVRGQATSVSPISRWWWVEKLAQRVGTQTNKKLRKNGSWSNPVTHQASESDESTPKGEVFR